MRTLSPHEIATVTGAGRGSCYCRPPRHGGGTSVSTSTSFSNATSTATATSTSVSFSQSFVRIVRPVFWW